VDVDPVADDFREWAAGLPYVVERDHGQSETARMYEVDCRPLGQRRTWLILDFETPDLPRPTSITVVLPKRVAEKAMRADWGCSDASTGDGPAFAPDDADRVIFRVNPLAGRRSVETLVLGAYRSIIDWT
jgi:hypothetical protein